MERGALGRKRASGGLLGAAGVLFLGFGGGFMGLTGFHPLVLFKLCDAPLVTFLYVCVLYFARKKGRKKRETEDKLKQKQKPCLELSEFT